jgi:hypothetical protein
MSEPIKLYKGKQEITVYGQAQARQMIDDGWCKEQTPEGPQAAQEGQGEAQEVDKDTNEADSDLVRAPGAPEHAPPDAVKEPVIVGLDPVKEPVIVGLDPVKAAQGKPTGKVVKGH